MADTSYLRLSVEPYVREQLAKWHNLAFTSRKLRLVTGGLHEFDAVSTDGRIIVGIKACALSQDGTLKIGQFRNAVTELYYLSLVEAPVRMLALTSEAFFKAFQHRIEGALVPSVSVICIPLPTEMQAIVERIISKAAKEVSPQTIRAAVEEELT